MVAGRRFASAKAQPTEVSSILENRIRGVSEEANLDETGRVLSVGYVSFCLFSPLLQCSLLSPTRLEKTAVVYAFRVSRGHFSPPLTGANLLDNLPLNILSETAAHESPI